MKHTLGIASKGKIDATQDLSDSEYKRYRESVSILQSFSRKQQLIQIVRLNYIDYKNWLKQCLDEFHKDASFDYVKMDKVNLNINRYILNYLSSVRTLLDHMETTLKRLYGNNSHKVIKFKDVCSKAYDEHFSYRFLYKLRDYAQHCELPLGGVSITSKEDHHIQEM